MAKIRKTEGALMLMTKTPARTARDNDSEGQRGRGRWGGTTIARDGGARKVAMDGGARKVRKVRRVRRDNDGEG